MNQLSSLIADWLTAKEAERAANLRRVEIERQMTQLLPIEGAEGSVRAEAAGYAVRVSYKVTRSVDSEALTSLWQGLDARAKRAFSWKATVKAKELHALQDMAPDIYRTIAGVIETSPAKPSVSIDAIERGTA